MASNSLAFMVASFLAGTIYYPSNLLQDLDNTSGFSNRYSPRYKETFDYIIVGGGTSGSVLATRLSEDPAVSVLLVEAGSDGNALYNAMSGNVFGRDGKDYDWRYKTYNTMTSCLGFKKGQCVLNKGKVLGGSSIDNGLIYTRGNPKDFDRWEEEGNPGWAFKDVLPLFKKIENYGNVPGLDASPYHGLTGNLKISLPTHPTQLTETFLRASNAFGYDTVDYNGERQSGVSLPHLTKLGRRKSNVVHDYLEPAHTRHNLKVALQSRVYKILMNTTNHAYGVEYYRQGVRNQVFATKEVIVAAGTIGSAHLLKVSGIGPRKELDALQIPVYADLPVGLNMESHVSFLGLIYVMNVSAGMTFDQMKRNMDQSGEVMSTSTTALGFFNTDSNDDPTWPDIVAEFSDVNTLKERRSPVYRSLARVREEIREVYQAAAASEIISVYPYVARPRSRGRVTIYSRSLLEHPPHIETGWFSDPRDVMKTLQAIKLIRQILESEPFQRYKMKLYPATIPACRALEPLSDDYWVCHIKQLSIPTWDDTSTCRMGPNTDPTAVVDSKLRVHRVSGLRIADLSVLPHIPTGNTMAAAYLVGEKAAELIKKGN